jgi:predicted metalloprotease with PDZ domain
MLHYTFSYENPHRHFIDIKFQISEHSEKELFLQLPAWRPGRYELGDFAKNIQKFSVVDVHGNPLKFEKTAKDTWKVFTPNCSKITVSYNYYANELNAGSTYLDEYQLYVNPVNCCLFIPSRINDACNVQLEVPKAYEIACSLSHNKHQLKAKNFDELAESPWIASAGLQHNSYNVEGIEFHIWFQGVCKPAWSKILKDFKAFTILQIKDFTAFPVSEYHFINQILPYKTYHGVEHTANTVISLGPGDALMSDKMYASLLGVSSHELYHTWNIKQIRPEVLLPYDYTKENYSRMGYLYEGVTTYMGDLYLRRAKVFSEQEFYKTQEENLQKHFHNGGRLNMSVADSSFDTWLDGYVLGVPNRKVSIYTEGALCAMMLDIYILEKSAGQVSLRSLMTNIYKEYACRGKGLSEENYIDTLLQYGGSKALAVVENHIYGTKEFSSSIKEVLSIVGLDLKTLENPNVLASSYGLKTVLQKDGLHLKQVQIAAAADIAKMAVGDVITAINGAEITKDLLSSLNTKETITVQLKKRFETIDVKLTADSQLHYPLFKIVPIQDRSEVQKMLFEKWINS